MDEQMRDAVDKVRGGMSRAQFVREAIALKLGLSAKELAAMVAPPDRAGKGGPKKKPLAHPPPDLSVVLNEEPGESELPLPSPQKVTFKRAKKKPKTP